MVKWDYYIVSKRLCRGSKCSTRRKTPSLWQAFLLSASICSDQDIFWLSFTPRYLKDPFRSKKIPLISSNKFEKELILGVLRNMTNLHLSTFRVKRLSLSQLQIHLRLVFRLSSSPAFDNFEKRTRWSTVSKAFDKSKKTAPVTRLLSIFSRTKSVKWVRASSVDSFGLKPNWRGIV